MNTTGEERRERDALEIIVAASRAVVESLQYDNTVRAIARMAVPRFADLVFVHVADENGTLERQEAAARDEEKMRLLADLARSVPTQTERLRHIFETGKSELHADIAHTLWSDIPNPAHRDMLQSLGIRSVISAAMRMSGRSMGVMTFARTDSSPAYDQADVVVAEELARMAAIAVQKSRLFEAEHRAREEAERASRAKDEFLAILSHELRTPMTTVIGWADFLKMTHGNDPALAKPVDALRNSARVQAKLVDDLLDVSRIVTGKLTIRPIETELVGIVRAAVDSIRITAEEKNIAIHLDLPEERVTLTGDPDRLHQIVLNLLSNAVKFTNRGAITVSVRKRSRHAEISVADTGEGIAPDFLPHVFDRFRQGSVGDSRRHSGLGLGLSIVQHLVRLHGGNVRAESEGAGKGARFTVTLPL